MPTLEERMASYAAVPDIRLMKRTPVIIRVDGRAFHNYTKVRKCAKPFDYGLHTDFVVTSARLMLEMQGCVAFYTQSDEASFLLIDYQRFETEPWVSYRLEKLVSLSASIFTQYFNAVSYDYPAAAFDSRAFNIPREEVVNYFLWRARDWARNSLFIYASKFFSAKQLHGKNSWQLHEMLHSKDKNWAALEGWQKNGTLGVNGLMTIDDTTWTHAALTDYLDPFIYCDEVDNA